MTWIENICDLSKNHNGFTGSNQLKYIQLDDLKKIIISRGLESHWDEVLHAVEEAHKVPFIITNDSVFSYNIWTKVCKIAPIVKHEELEFLERSNLYSIRWQITEKLEKLSPSAFEVFVVELVRHSKRYDRVSLSPKTRDGGVDFRAFYTDEEGRKSRIVGEVKKWNKPIPEIVIDRLASSMEREKIRSGEQIRGVLVTLEGVSPIAQNTAAYQQIEVWDRDTIIRMVLKQKLGIRGHTLEAPEDGYWEEYDDL